MERFFRKLFLEQNQNPHVTDFLVRAKAKDMITISEFMGSEAVSSIKDFGGVFYLKNPDKKIYENLDKWGKPTAGKGDVEFIVRGEGRILLFYGYFEQNTNKNYKNSKVYSKSLYFHFMFEKDFLEAVSKGNDILDMDLFSKQKKRIGKSGLNSNSLSFFRKMKRVSELVDKDVLFVLSSPDNQRERVYKRMVKRRRNFKFEK